MADTHDDLAELRRDAKLFRGPKDSIPVTLPVEAQTLDDLFTELTALRAACKAALKHADANGMNDWPIFKRLRKAVEHKENERE